MMTTLVEDHFRLHDKGDFKAALIIPEYEIVIHPWHMDAKGGRDGELFSVSRSRGFQARLPRHGRSIIRFPQV